MGSGLGNPDWRDLASHFHSMTTCEIYQFTLINTYTYLDMYLYLLISVTISIYSFYFQLRWVCFTVTNILTANLFLSTSWPTRLRQGFSLASFSPNYAFLLATSWKMICLGQWDIRGTGISVPPFSLFQCGYMRIFCLLPLGYFFPWHKELTNSRLFSGFRFI